MAAKDVRSSAAPGRRRRRAPIDFVVGGEWPYATLALHPQDVVEDLHAAIYTQAVVANLVSRMGTESHRSLSTRTGIPPRTIDYLIAGQTVPDLATLARLEVALGIPLLPAGRLKLVPGYPRAQDQ